MASLQVAWTVTEQNVRNFVEAGGEQGVQRVFEYKTLAGVAGRSPLWQMVQHVVNHGSYHRGQVTTMLRQLGAKPSKSMDLVAFYRVLPAHRRRRAGLRCIVRASRARRHTSARDIKETRMASGTIKRIARDKGFGFIRDGGGQEWFFHRSSVQGSFDSLNEGQRVSFDEEQSPKGPRAGNVRAE